MKISNEQFLQFLNEHGGAKPLEEAFKNYDPKEEWHEGKIENILMEDDEIYNPYLIGDIVFVKNYNYKDGAIGTNHLFVIISQNNLAVPIENFGMLISSKIEKAKYETNKILKKNLENGLKKDSIVKTDVIYKIYNDSILFKIGSIKKEIVDEYIESYMKSKQ